MSAASTWLGGLVTHRRGRLVGVAAGIALSVALLVSLGSFLASSKATMTQRSAATVSVDWQVQVAGGADAAAVASTVGSTPGTGAADVVRFAAADGFSATTGGSQQSTGAGVVVGLPPGYGKDFPGVLRSLAGQGGAGTDGVMLLQQTAANLRAGVGDTVTVTVAGRSTTLVVNGIVDLPQADSFFQSVGAPPQSQPIAPPDNVVLMPTLAFDSAVVPLAQGRPDLLTSQVHAARTHNLPPDPAAAFTAAAGSARNTEVALAGAGTVGDNLGATLDAARQDSLYAQVLFLFLGVPGAVIAGALTAAVAGAGATRRRQEQALLRTRGATRSQVLRLAGVEAAAAAVVGALFGVGGALLASRIALGAFPVVSTTTALWALVAVVAGVVLAFVAVLVPARRDLDALAVTSSRASVTRDLRAPLWARWGLDFLVLSVALVIFWVTSRTGYALVLAPEGVATLSVSYWAFAGPALLWLACAMLAWRLTDLVLRRGAGPLTAIARPLVGSMAGPVVATLRRQRRGIAGAVVMLTLAVAFAASTATFNDTYRQQAEVDARLTNGADVTVTESPGSSTPPSAATAIAKVPGVASVEPLQHRYAYVGADLQDLYGIRPGTIAGATSLPDAYFAGGTASQLLATMAQQPDALLVSAETVKDFQLRPGDALTLRLQDGATKEYTDVPFHYAGVAKEFPTAPKDSFLVANADYVATVTGSDTVGSFLVDTGGASTAAVAAGVQKIVGPTAAVTEIGTSRAVIGSSLTAVDLSGLTRIELGFAALLATASGALLLGLGLTERRRALGITAALGASRRQLASFVVAEAAAVVVAGTALGALAGAALTTMLVKVLTGVFDPPPASIPVPWGYLGAVVGVTVVAVALVVVAVVRRGHDVDVTVLRGR